jgi:hypothetical protein
MDFFSRSGPQIRDVMAALRTWHSEWKGAQQQTMAAFDGLKAQLDAGAAGAAVGAAAASGCRAGRRRRT